MENKRKSNMLAEYKRIKDECNEARWKRFITHREVDTLLLFRRGDTFEAYFDDAKVISSATSLTLMVVDGIATVNFPIDRLGEYYGKLVDAGHFVQPCPFDLHHASFEL